jgi:hypothetical protein
MEEKDLEILQKIADGYPKDSEEYATLSMAAKALIFVSGQEAKADFKEYIRNTAKPLSALDLIYIKQCGLEIPEDLRNEKINELEKDIDEIVAKLNAYNEEIKQT